MDIRGQLLDGIGQDQVDELDNRRIFRGLLQLADVDGVLFGNELEVAIIEIGHDIVERCPGVVILLDRAANGLFRGDHDLHVIACEELDVVNREDIGRI